MRVLWYSGKCCGLWVIKVQYAVIANTHIQREGGRKGEREEGRERGRKEGRERRRKGEREDGRERERTEGREGGRGRERTEGRVGERKGHRKNSIELRDEMCRITDCSFLRFTVWDH